MDHCTGHALSIISRCSTLPRLLLVSLCLRVPCTPTPTGISPLGPRPCPRSDDSLVVDHLTANNLPQTLSVFLPESGLGSPPAGPAVVAGAAGERDKGGLASEGGTGGVSLTAAARDRLARVALSREDILQGLPIIAGSAMFRRVLTRADHKDASHDDTPDVRGALESRDHVHGLLEALVAEVADKSQVVAVHSYTQTEELGRGHKENLGESEGRHRRDDTMRQKARVVKRDARERGMELGRGVGYRERFSRVLNLAVPLFFNGCRDRSHVPGRARAQPRQECYS